MICHSEVEVEVAISEFLAFNSSSLIISIDNLFVPISLKFLYCVFCSLCFRQSFECAFCAKVKCNWMTVRKHASSHTIYADTFKGACGAS